MYLTPILLCMYYSRIRKLRLHLMPLHNMDGSDYEDESDEGIDEEEDDREAAFIVSLVF